MMEKIRRGLRGLGGCTDSMKTDAIMRKLHRIFAIPMIFIFVGLMLAFTFAPDRVEALQMGMGPFMLVLVVTGGWMLVRPWLLRRRRAKQE